MKLPKDFNLKFTLDFLDSYNSNDLEYAFLWDDTPQGSDYWFNVYNDCCEGVRPPEQAIIQIQKWIIQS